MKYIVAWKIQGALYGKSTRRVTERFKVFDDDISAEDNYNKAEDFRNELLEDTKNTDIVIAHILSQELKT